MAIKNIMEKIISDRLNVLLTKYDCCKCEKCRNDMLAYALNLVDPKYVSTRAGELFGKLAALDSQTSIDIDIAVTKAIDVVARMPHHDDEQK